MINKQLVLKERIKLIRAMDEVAHSINDEYVFEEWLINGVPDGEIEPDTKDEELAWLVEDDKDWQNLLTVFSRIMYLAYKNGGIWAM